MEQTPNISLKELNRFVIMDLSIPCPVMDYHLYEYRQKGLSMFSKYVRDETRNEDLVMGLHYKLDSQSVQLLRYEGILVDSQPHFNDTSLSHAAQQLERSIRSTRYRGMFTENLDEWLQNDKANQSVFKRLCDLYNKGEKEAVSQLWLKYGPLWIEKPLHVFGEFLTVPRSWRFEVNLAQGEKPVSAIDLPAVIQQQSTESKLRRILAEKVLPDAGQHKAKKR